MHGTGRRDSLREDPGALLKTGPAVLNPV
jgi:hypothetical protein